jgi:subtilisin family serine protease
VTVTSPRRPRRIGLDLAALLTAVVVAGGALFGSGVAIEAATTPPIPQAVLDAPLHAFEWPTSAPNDPYFGNQLDLSAISVAPAWLRTTGAPTVVVAVLDTGVDATHVEFAGRVMPGFDALTGVADTAADLAATNDDEGHGTNVSGTIAAAADNAEGIAGIAPMVSIMPVKILDSTGTGDFGGMVAGMNWAIAHGARILTMSLGGDLGPAAVAALQPTFDAAYAAGAVVVAASGNDGAALDQYPCNFVHVICVGSATRDGSAVSTFSTRTAGIALVAPGESVISTLPGGRYGYGTGTSMATPHVTGAVALLRSVDPGISVDQVFADLTQTARPLAAGGRNPDSGYGLLQVGPALDLVAASTPIPTPSPTPDPAASPTPTPSASPTPSPTPTPVVPSVVATAPRNGSRGVARSILPTLSFSIPVAGVTTRTVTMLDLSRGRQVTIRISYSATSRRATVRPLVRLAANHSYRIFVAGITASSGGPALRRIIAVTFRTGYR